MVLPDDVSCPACNSTLVRTSIMRHELVRQTAERYKQGEITHEEMCAFVAEQQRIQAMRGDDIYRFIEENQYDVENEEETSNGLEGLALYEQGCELLRQCLEEGNTDQIEGALEQIDSGHLRLVQALHLNRESRKRDGGAHGLL
ncbi:MAG: hypothetical protein ACYCW6_22475 [Candidatus Xenobia bacterium]